MARSINLQKKRTQLIFSQNVPHASSITSMYKVVLTFESVNGFLIKAICIPVVLLFIELIFPNYSINVIKFIETCMSSRSYHFHFLSVSLPPSPLPRHGRADSERPSSFSI